MTYEGLPWPQGKRHIPVWHEVGRTSTTRCNLSILRGVIDTVSFVVSRIQPNTFNHVSKLVTFFGHRSGGWLGPRLPGKRKWSEAVDCTTREHGHPSDYKCASTNPSCVHVVSDEKRGNGQPVGTSNLLTIMRQRIRRTDILRWNLLNMLHRSRPLGQDGSVLKGTVYGRAQTWMRIRIKPWTWAPSKLTSKIDYNHVAYGVSERRCTDRVDQHLPKNIINNNSTYCSQHRH